MRPACLPRTKPHAQLTASMFLDNTELDLARHLLPILEKKTGRVIFNGYPIGVEVAYAMIHGGPFPATLDNRFTPAGANAISRSLHLYDN